MRSHVPLELHNELSVGLKYEENNESYKYLFLLLETATNTKNWNTEKILISK